MTLLRAAYRTMLASYFITSGVRALRDPDSLVPVAEPLTDRVVPLLKEYAPQQVAGFVPEDARTLVRVNGAAQVAGGLALASGKGRRLGALLLAGSLVPSTIAKHPFWSRSDAAERANDQHQFLKNVSLLGG
ncbi:MAG TPA: DoxX family membrane protein, partial [Propionibacteriaceae bacterium]|nr:DoxX family membrane protein [Propionibacteriaceae bacterium]